VEGTHWDPRWSSPEDVGFKLLACNLSDIAAMGGLPGPFLLALSVRRPLDAGAVLGLARGIEEGRRAHRLDAGEVAPIGGDVTAVDGPSVYTLVLLGRERRPGWRLLRSGALAGDDLWVSGPLGAAAAGLAALRAGLEPARWAELVVRHRRPVARLDLGPRLARLAGVHAAIDLSDGLAGDLPHLLDASGVGAEVELARIPVADGVAEVARATGADALDLAAGGGEDYELLIAADPAAEAALRELAMFRIGRVVVPAGPPRWLDARGRPRDLAVRGYRHA
jgi:thiamine-monophosphate kinase